MYRAFLSPKLNFPSLQKREGNRVETSFEVLLFIGPTSISFFFSKSSLKKKIHLLNSEEIPIIESRRIDPDNAMQFHATLETVYLSLMRLKRKLPAGIVSGWRPKTVPDPEGWPVLHFM